MASFGEVLAEFKASEEAENVVPLMEDKQLQNGVVAWKSVTVKHLELADCPETDPVKKWEWMWGRVKYELEGFAAVAGVRIQDVGPLINRMIGLRLIYPDGTINKLAKQYMQSMILAKIRGVIGKKEGGHEKAGV
jgi:hypothetical protein